MEWKEIQPANKTKVYQLGDEPITIHVIKVRDNEYIVVHVTGYDKQDDTVKFHTKKSLLEKYDIEIDIELKTYKDIELFNFETFDKESVITCIKELRKKEEKTGALFGMLLSDNYNDNYYIQLSNVSHNIKNLYIVDNKVIGNIEILNTPMGIKLQKIINDVGIENMHIVPNATMIKSKNTDKTEIIKPIIDNIYSFNFYN